ncbi:MAG: hypothetical protein L0Z53_16225 [Acidobacteriales bacterium]|nr:hypothetical protein [Terriglobales bacterium]
MRRKCESVSLTAEQQALVEQHLWLVEVIGQKLRKSLPSHADYEDLIQAGSLGLIAAAQRYDGRTGTKFRSYAGPPGSWRRGGCENSRRISAKQPNG